MAIEKVTSYKAEDGSLHETAREAHIKNAKSKLIPYVNSFFNRNRIGINNEDLPMYLICYLVTEYEEILKILQELKNDLQNIEGQEEVSFDLKNTEFTPQS